MRAADKGLIGKQVVDWQQALKKRWATLRFGEVKVESGGERFVFEVQIYLDDLHPQAAEVELYAEGINGDGPERRKMERLRPLTGASGGYVYGASVPAARPASDYTARMIPHYSGVAVPLEAAHILWQQ